MRKFFIFFLFCTATINAQINLPLLSGEWTKVKMRMADGSKVLDESYLSSKFYQWKIYNNKLCMRSKPVSDYERSCVDYNLQNQTIVTSQQSGYEIIKLTGDSLIVAEKIDGNSTADKTKKLWFVRSINILKDFKERTKNENIITANENFTPTLKKNLILEINENFRKKGNFPNFNIIGNIVFFPKKSSISLDILNADQVVKFQKYVDIIKNIIESSYKDWNLDEFASFDKVTLPFIIQSKSHSVGDNAYYTGASIYYFTNNVNDIDKIGGIKFHDLTESRRAFADGIAAFQNKKYDKALQCFSKSYEKDRRNVYALYNSALIYDLQKDTEHLCSTLKILMDLEQTEGTNLYDKRCIKK